jgi:hypothetical protein
MGFRETARNAKRTTKAKKGMGFKAAQKQIMNRSGVDEEAAGAILASSARKASAGAKRRNPNLKKVK